MKRREFIGKTSCGMAGIPAAGAGLASNQEQPPLPPRKRYKIEIEIFEVGEKTTCFKKGEKFKYPKNYSPHKLLEKGFGIGDYNIKSQKVKLKFTKEVAYLIRERYWHNSQIISEIEYGEIILEMEVPISYELMAFIYSFGSNIKVLAPNDLLLKVKKDREKKIY